MSKWEKVKLGDLGTFKSGGTPSRSKPEYFQGNIPWITTVSLGEMYINNSNAVEFITEAAIKESSTKIINSDSVMIGVRVGVGKASINTVPMATSQDITSIENIDNNKVYKPYLISFIRSCMMIFDSSKRGATIKGVNSEMLKSLLVPLPPLEVQKQIAKNLDTVSELLALRKKQLEELDGLIKSVFYDMFGDPVTNDKGWEVSNLQNKIFIKHGFAFDGEYFSNSGPYVLLTPGNFYEEGGYRDRGEKQKYYLGEPKEDYILNRDDLLIAMTEQAQGLLGSPLFVPESNKFLHNQRLGLIQVINEDLNKKYLFYLFNDYNVRNIIHLMATGIKVRHTSPSKLGEIVVAIPPLSLQDEFASIVTKIEEQKYLVEKSIKETQVLFDSLMSQYFD